MAKLNDIREMLRVKSTEEYDALCRKRRGGQLGTPKGTVLVYVNEGRWVADCPACKSGMACWSAVPIVTCLDCGSRWSVTFPSENDQAGIEAALLKRDPEHRHWLATETVADLEAENEAGAVSPVVMVTQLEQRLAALEGQWRALQIENAQLRQAAAGRST